MLVVCSNLNVLTAEVEIEYAFVSKHVHVSGFVVIMEGEV